MSNHGEAMLRMVDQLLEGKIAVDEFYDSFYRYYLYNVPDDALDEREDVFIGEINERLDRTDSAPAEESVKYGWIDHAEFVKWLREARDRYKEGR